jgi:hypothetical protein
MFKLIINLNKRMINLNFSMNHNLRNFLMYNIGKFEIDIFRASHNVSIRMFGSPEDLM